LYYLDLINLITFFNKLFFITKYHQTRHEGHMSRTLLYSAVFQWTLRISRHSMARQYQKYQICYHINGIYNYESLKPSRTD